MPEMQSTATGGRTFHRQGPPPPATAEALRELQERLTRPRPAEPPASLATPADGHHPHPGPEAPRHEWAQYFHRLGFRLCAIPAGTKGPSAKGWPEADVPAEHWLSHPQDGLGAVLGPSRLVSLDLDHLAHSRTILEGLGLEWDALLAGAILIRGNPARLRAVFRAPPDLDLSRKSLAWPSEGEGGKPVTVFELRGGPVQDVLPPTDHPETGRPYEWVRPPWDLERLATLPPALLELWTGWDSWHRALLDLCPWTPPTPEPEARPTPRPAPPAGGESVIEQFNACHDPAMILAANGYTPKGRDRWLSPHSTSGLAGITRLSETGRIFCHHASDPLSGPPHDAFSLFTVLEHGGDTRQAIKAAARLLGITAPRGNSGDIGDIGDQHSTPPHGQNRNSGDIGDIGDRKSRSTPPADDAWPELVELETPDLPRLGADILPAWAGTFAAALAKATETPPELATSLTLAVAAVPCARRLRLQVSPGHQEPANLWLSAALPPANRKSAVHAACCAPLMEWEREAAANMAGEIRQAESEAKTLQARANAARAAAARAKEQYEILAATKEATDLEALIQPPPAAPQLWTSDATPERLGSLLADQGECMAWLSSEAGIFDLLAGRYSKGIPNLDLVLKAWSGDPERVDRGSRPPVYLLSPRLTIGLSPQPEAMRGLANQPGFRGRGLLGRFLYLLPPSPLGYRDLSCDREGAFVPKGIAEAYRQGIRAMLDWPAALDQEGREQPYLLTLSRPAYGEWLEFARTVERGMRPGGEYEHTPDLAGKIPGGAARIACVLHGIEYAHGRPWEAEISLATMERALEIAAACLRHGQAAMLLMGGDPGVSQAQKVWAWLQRGRRTEASLRDAYQALKGSFPRVSGLVSALELLEERGYLVLITPETTGAGRPPSPRIIIRPDLARAWQ